MSARTSAASSEASTADTAHMATTIRTARPADAAVLAAVQSVETGEVVEDYGVKSWLPGRSARAVVVIVSVFNFQLVRMSRGRAQ